MTRHYLDLGSASDWPCFNQSGAIPWIWVVTRHQYGISAIVLDVSSREASGSIAKCRLFSQASKFWAVFAIVQIVNQK